MSELSHFELESAKTPTKQPWAILGGTLALLILSWMVSHFAPNEAIKTAKKDAAAAAAPVAAAASAAEDDDDI
jgi:hypothetical protein